MIDKVIAEMAIIDGDVSGGGVGKNDDSFGGDSGVGEGNGGG